ncbi:hypothetical protein D1007_31683 [Hordeum vulgare]|nr:hypothetical protein D1007_31683 [Hordeum vulgare]
MSPGMFANSVTAESRRSESIGVFMPNEDYTTVLRLKVITIELPNTFLNDTVAVQAAIVCTIRHLLPETVPTSVGVMYLRFASAANQ